MKIIWTIEFLDEAERDLKMLDRSAQLQVLKELRYENHRYFSQNHQILVHVKNKTAQK